MRSNPHRFAKRDANHADIVAVYEGAMFSVVDLSAVGFGLSDVLIGGATPKGRIERLVEIKTEDGEETPAQLRFRRDWRGTPPRIIRSPEEAIAHVRELRAS